MKTLIVYYTLEGNTEYAVEKIKDKIEADSLKLIPKKAYSDKGFKKFFWGGKSAVFGDKPEIEDYSINLSSYERIVFGFPVWAGTFTPPLRTFIENNKEALSGKHFASFACQGGSGAEKAFDKLAKCIGIESFESTGIFIDPKEKQTEETDAAIEAFATSLN